jgi:hypothetical protein
MGDYIIGTYSKCCKIFREGKVAPGTVHTANCYYHREERGETRHTFYLGVIGDAEEKVYVGED